VRTPEPHELCNESSKGYCNSGRGVPGILPRVLFPLRRDVYAEISLIVSLGVRKGTIRLIADYLPTGLDLNNSGRFFASADRLSVKGSLGRAPVDEIGATEHPQTEDAWDYLHINSVDKDDEGSYLISGRHTSTVYKLSGVDGSVIWRLGGRNSTFPLSDDVAFAYQHDARFRSRSADGSIETISLFENAALTDGKKVHPSSSARIFQLNHTSNTATELQKFPAPDGLSAQSQRKAHVLKTGNVFVNWGQAGAVTEFRASDAEPIFHEYLDSGSLGPGVQSYRGFRYEWEGRPRERPAVAALRSGSETSVYVSWNGDTAAVAWEFFAVTGRAHGAAFEAGARTHKLGAVRRESFETVLVVSSATLQAIGENVRVFAIALDTNGRAVGRSGGVSFREEIRPAGRVPAKPRHGYL